MTRMAPCALLETATAKSMRVNEKKNKTILLLPKFVLSKMSQESETF